MIEKTRRGMTLLETVVAILCMTLLATALYALLFSGGSFWQSVSARAALRQNLQVFDEKAAVDMTDTDAGNVTVNSGNPQAFSLLSAVNQSGSFITDSNGAPLWQKYVVYCIPDGTTDLYRKEIYGSFTVPLTVGQLVSDCDGAGELITSYASAISLVVNTSTHTASLSATLSAQNGNGMTERESRAVTVFMRD